MTYNNGFGNGQQQGGFGGAPNYNNPEIQQRYQQQPQQAQNDGGELGWDDTIQKDSNSFVRLKPGEYEFTVKSFERGRHGGSDKLPPCNKAIIKVEIETNEGTAILTSNLFLHSKTEGLLSSFFGSIGLKKHGEPLRMDWNAIIGRKGRCKVGTREYKGETYTDLKSFIYAEDVKGPALNSPQQGFQGQQQGF